MIGNKGNGVSCYKYKTIHHLNNYIWSHNKYFHYKMSLLSPESQQEYIKDINEKNLLLDQLSNSTSITSTEFCILNNISIEPFYHTFGKHNKF